MQPQRQPNRLAGLRICQGWASLPFRMPRNPTLQLCLRLITEYLRLVNAYPHPQIIIPFPCCNFVWRQHHQLLLFAVSLVNYEKDFM